MAIKKRTSESKSKSKKSTAASVHSRNRKQNSGISTAISAKTSDILSVLDHGQASRDISVGHIVEAQPVCMIVSESLNLQWYVGEAVAVRWINGEPYFYIHFLGEDSKMDDWLPRSKIRALKSTDVERRMNVTSLNATFFALSSFSASASSVYPRHSIKSVRGVQLGNSVLLRAWYPSPYPEMISCPNSYIKICDTCLSYFKTADELSRHWNYCAFSHPPGVEIYRDDESPSGSMSVFEIDGEAYNGYCERLLLLAKLFLEEKRACSQDTSQYAQVRTFHFYVVCRWNVETGRAELVGYFSKLKNEKRESHILSCILVLPHEQRKGFGNFLIDVSYKLATIEGRVGSAERPLSKLGQLSFYPYWMRRLVPLLKRNCERTLILSDLSRASGIVNDDIVEVLKYYGLLKEWGSAGVVVIAAFDALESFCPDRVAKRDIFNPAFLHWTPSYRLLDT
jgi:histone acetyltransferase HTATIP